MVIAMCDNAPLLEMKGVTKVYGNGIVANKEVSLSVRKGEIHALIGENGAGKSTLMKILFGIEQPDSGTILLNGEPVSIHSSTEAIRLGIGMVQQHYQQVPAFTVAENLVLGREPKRGILFDRKKAVEICKEFSKKYELAVQPERRVSDISLSERQKLEILKALYGGARLLILDEPTAVLMPQEIAEFFRQLKMLRDKGHTIIFISHRLKELLQICDRMTVMRAGTTVGVYDNEGCDEQEISRRIVGRDVVLKVEKQPPKPGKRTLTVKDVRISSENGGRAVDDVSFTVREGEIVGIAAVEGNGQKELADAITGRAAYQKGSICFKDTEVSKTTVQKLREQGMGYISEDRMGVGAAPGASVQNNLIALVRRKPAINRKGFFRFDAIAKLCRELIAQFEIKCSSKDVPVSMLSGGNIQKVVIARELSGRPPLLIAQQPTRGVDVGSVEFIHRNLIQQRDTGSAVLLISADLSEVLALSDSLLVMHKGRIQAYFETTEGLTEHDVGEYMLGLKRQNAAQVGGAYHEG